MYKDLRKMIRRVLKKFLDKLNPIITNGFNLFQPKYDQSPTQPQPPQSTQLEVLQVVSEPRSWVRTPGVSLGGRLLTDRRVGRVHQLPLCSSWALG